ncbi:cytochrome P450 26B1-like [Megalops cyprinoides]|uniref:cytochrome P450 26B1-like n=1 Tax=Megalops cyprinoides TaxID=118141 RepID=UPI001863F191|nr:cytochrome P450 26B1-like [Megalops cyprinoides]XP_036402883.1 cytochrome P450 26B1-like [Megalops cyprinoides]
MSLFELSHFSVLATAVTSVLSALLLLAVSRQLWTFRWTITRDRAYKLPLPQGSMGWPLVGETFHWLFQGSSFHISRRAKYGNVFKTHLLGKPVIRVTGAENIRKILLGEHNLVCTQWPQSTRIILGPNTLVNSIGDLHKQKRKILVKVFSRGALETYIPRLQDVVKSEIAKWCSEPGSVNVYTAAKSLTFRIAVRVLLGLTMEEDRIIYLSRIFEELMSNLFSLPIDVPLSGLRKGIKARDVLHACMEKIIEEKLQMQQAAGYRDAFDYMLSSAKESGYELSRQELKESAVELIFAAHSTTASASTSLIMQLLRHPAVCEKARLELQAQGLGCDTYCPKCSQSKTRNLDGEGVRSKKQQIERDESKNRPGAETGFKVNDTWTGECDSTPDSREKRLCSGSHLPHLSFEKLNRLRYLDCVVKEVLRFLPPVSGGYRTVLKTFELDGYQIPKGWSVMYSIRDTHETAAVFQNPELFDPDRFGDERDESKTGRFNYVPFGGGIRSCIGRELAQIILKTLAIELLATTECELATETFPKMQTVPIVHPVNGLHVYFKYRNCGADHLLNSL